MAWRGADLAWRGADLAWRGAKAPRMDAIRLIRPDLTPDQAGSDA